VTFGKSTSDATVSDKQTMAQAMVDNLTAMKSASSIPPLEKTDDLLNQRVAQELDYAGRLLETVEKDLAKRGVRGPIVDLIGETEQMLNDLSGVVDAKDRCAGIERIEAPNMKRRLLRRDLGGQSLVCKQVPPVQADEV
jgi:hypothetical protein